jgi:hypothetical protein
VSGCAGFAFANVEAAAEFEEQRARFFSDQERYDDYMEMREGLDLSNFTGFKEHVIALSDPDRMPWYAKQAVFWICSFCLLSWPLRLVLEYNTAYLHYQVTKLETSYSFIRFKYKSLAIAIILETKDEVSELNNHVYLYSFRM